MGASGLSIRLTTWLSTLIVVDEENGDLLMKRAIFCRE
jgi:hypothetical protein